MSPPECPRCKGTNFTIKTCTLDGEDLYRVLECKDCWNNELKRMVDEVAKNRPDLIGQYSKAKLRTDYYGTVTIKDIIDDET
jgi:predicted nucleic-acid-binding Zn-ribbon protein